MIRKPVQSRALKSIGYDPTTGTVEAEYTSGKVYRFANVPPDVFAQVEESESLGQAFNQHINRKFESTLLPPPEEK